MVVKPSKKVFIGLSGGVDSSVSAALLKRQGFDVTGVFIKVWTPPFMECTWKGDRLDAMRVCAKLDIPFMTLDLEKEYKREVVDYMLAEYRAGRTPNPDVMCNKEIKFGAFYKFAMKNGADFVATGHYAQIKKDVSGNLGLYVSADANKDQSYFVWNITREQLPHILFPVGHLKKPEVRKLAHQYGLITADKKDSQGLCFLGKIDMKDFLTHFIEEKEGNVLDINGKKIGMHRGAFFYTLGERHGFDILQKSSADKPVYVVSKDMKKNTITVATKDYIPVSAVSKIKLSHVNWLVDSTGKGLVARARYRQDCFPITIDNKVGNTATVQTRNPEQSITPGQSLVLYEDGRLVGAGVIEALM